MKLESIAIAATAGSMLIAGTASSATLINEYDDVGFGNYVSGNITAMTSSVEDNNSSKTGAKTIDSSGLSTLTGGGTHESSTGKSWMSEDNGVIAWENDVAWDPDTFDEYIEWDLGAAYVLGSVQVWNYNDSSRYDSGINQLDIWVSSLASPGDPEAGGAADWTLLGADVNLSKAPGAGTYTGVDLATDTGISLPGTAVRWVRFEIDSNHWDGGGFGNDGSLLSENQVALSEIQFFEAIPEPSSAVLLGIGGLALAFRRRK